MKIQNFQLEQNISWTVDMNMQISEFMMSLPHSFPYILSKNVWDCIFYCCSNMSKHVPIISEQTLFGIYSVWI